MVFVYFGRILSKLILLLLDSYEEICWLHEFLTVPWLIGGDFNEICYDSEKLGGNKRPSSQMEAFRNTINDGNLQSLHYVTWVINRRQSDRGPYF